MSRVRKACRELFGISVQTIKIRQFAGATVLNLRNINISDLKSVQKVSPKKRFYGLFKGKNGSISPYNS